MSTIEQLRQKYELLAPFLDERQKRLWAGSEARAIGRGGITRVVQATGLARGTVHLGVHELQAFQDDPGSILFPNHLHRPSSRKRLTDEDPSLLANPEKPIDPLPRAAIPEKTSHRPSPESNPYRVRLPGAGRKLTEVKDPTILAALEKMVEGEVAGDPMSEQKWVRSSLHRLSERLATEGHQASPHVVARLLKDMGFSLKANKRKQGRPGSPERDAQFLYIASLRKRFTAAGLPLISVDTKKKELIGNFRNPGRVWCREAAEVDEHGFPSAAEGVAVPFGVYDMTKNTGYVVVSLSHNTPEFAVSVIAKWWESEGLLVYPNAKELLIFADGGGGNGSRAKAWKLNLQENLSNRFRLTITVCHPEPPETVASPMSAQCHCPVTNAFLSFQAGCVHRHRADTLPRGTLGPAIRRRAWPTPPLARSWQGLRSDEGGVGDRRSFSRARVAPGPHRTLVRVGARTFRRPCIGHSLSGTR